MVTLKTMKSFRKTVDIKLIKMDKTGDGKLQQMSLTENMGLPIFSRNKRFIKVQRNERTGEISICFYAERNRLLDTRYY